MTAQVHQPAFDWPEPRPTIQQQFQRFHLAHAEVYDGLLKLTRQAASAGRTRIGIAMLFEVLRWQWIIAGLPDEDEAWKLNNNYKSRYARLIMRRNPDLDGMFELRVLTAP
jgi:hypothetical protein